MRAERMELPKSGEAYFADLKRRLKKAGISYGALAWAMDTQTTQVSRWMNGRVTNIRLSQIHKIEKAY